MRIELSHSIIRSWKLTDADDLCRNANNPKVAATLDDGFPQPYLQKDAQLFIKSRIEMNPMTHFAIEFKGRAIGAIGFDFQLGAQRATVNLGYWIGEKYWGHGICTEAIRGMTRFIFREHPHIQRVQALVFDWNLASCRALEKAGYQCDGRHRHAVIKNDRAGDLVVYGKIREPEAEDNPVCLRSRGCRQSL